MAKNNRSKHKPALMNHITSLDTKTLQNVLRDNFGFGIEEMMAVLAGDEKVAKELGEASKQGRRASKYAPRVAQAIQDVIDGTKSINLESAKLLKNAGSTYTQIQKAANGTLQANQKYIHDRELNAIEYSLGNELEAKRHEYAKTLLEQKFFYDTYFLEVQEDARLEEQSYRPELKQLQEDERYQEARLDHLLTNGQDSDLSLLVPRDYVETSPGGSGILGTIKSFVGALRSGTGW